MCIILFLKMLHRMRDEHALMFESCLQIIPVSLPHTRAALAAYYILVSAEAASNLARYTGIYFGRDGRVP